MLRGLSPLCIRVHRPSPVGAHAMHVTRPSAAASTPAAAASLLLPQRSSCRLVLNPEIPEIKGGLQDSAATFLYVTYPPGGNAGSRHADPSRFLLLRIPDISLFLARERCIVRFFILFFFFCFGIFYNFSIYQIIYLNTHIYPSF